MFYRVISFFAIIGVFAAGITVFAQTEKQDPAIRLPKIRLKLKIKNRKRAIGLE